MSLDSYLIDSAGLGLPYLPGCCHNSGHVEKFVSSRFLFNHRSRRCCCPTIPVSTQFSEIGEHLQKPRINHDLRNRFVPRLNPQSKMGLLSWNTNKGYRSTTVMRVFSRQAASRATYGLFDLRHRDFSAVDILSRRQLLSSFPWKSFLLSVQTYQF